VMMPETAVSGIAAPSLWATRKVGVLALGVRSRRPSIRASANKMGKAQSGVETLFELWEDTVGA
jgi:hypothetical protein